ncbi:DUF2975 domain-containing protein [Cecembia sp.]|uniref:DUF2975 domain-containing protein n=1 Tax=Cecembia sp. TaxID=1898110 RepID=UPI0025BEE11B|nr:DUF2975 domain-containing protein [Cecembia sp.]
MKLTEQWKEKWESQPGLMLITVVIWSIFIGLCIKAGALLFTSIYSLFKPTVAQDLFEGLNLYGLMNQEIWYYIGLVSLLIGIACLKAYMFYLMIRIFLTINLNHPFSKKVSDLISEIASVAIQTGILIIITTASLKWLIKRGFDIPSMGNFTGGAFEFLLLGALLYAIAQVFKKGVALQSENELTI